MEQVIIVGLASSFVSCAIGFMYGHKKGIEENIISERKIIYSKFLKGHEGLTKLLMDSRALLSNVYTGLGNAVYDPNSNHKPILLNIQKEINNFLLSSDFELNKNIKDCDESKIEHKNLRKILEN